MAVTEEHLNQLRAEFHERLTSVSVDVMGALSALSDHNARFDRMDERFDRMDKRFDRMDERFDALSTSVDLRLTHLDQKIDARFEFLDQKFDRRFDALNDKLDSRFGWQTMLIAGATFAAVFAEPIRNALGW